MKKSPQLFLLLFIFSFSISNVIAQSSNIRNLTGCTFNIDVNMGQSNCTAIEAQTTSYTISPNSVIVIPGPLVINKAEGVPNPATPGCQFSIRKRCVGPVGAVVVNCQSACGTRYRVMFQGDDLVIRP